MSFEEFVKLPGLVSRYNEINAVQFQLQMSNGSSHLYRTRDLLHGRNSEITSPHTIPVNNQTVEEEAVTICTLLNPDQHVMEQCIPEMTESLCLLLQHLHENIQLQLELSRL